jgi:hypothetical protein
MWVEGGRISSFGRHEVQVQHGSTTIGLTVAIEPRIITPKSSSSQPKQAKQTKTQTKQQAK